MASSTTNRVRLPSINELTSSTSSYSLNVLQGSQQVRSSVKHDAYTGASINSSSPHTQPNYILSTNRHQSPMPKVAGFDYKSQQQQPPIYIPSLTVRNPIFQHGVPSQLPLPPPPPPLHSHQVGAQQTPNGPVSPSQQYQLFPPQQQHPSAQLQYTPPPTHMQSSPIQYPPYPHSYVTPQQSLSHPATARSPISHHLHRPTFYQRPPMFPHGASVSGDHFVVPEVINKPNNKCHRCGTTETPEWRRGPNGVRTLCNACGLFHAKLVKRKGAALAADEVLNNKVCKGKNGRRISIKRHDTEISKYYAMSSPNYQQTLPPIMGSNFAKYTIPSAIVRP
jgi:hypothetical protein